MRARMFGRAFFSHPLFRAYAAKSIIQLFCISISQQKAIACSVFFCSHLDFTFKFTFTTFTQNR